jgi:hypothetical protein
MARDSARPTVQPKCRFRESIGWSEWPDLNLRSPRPKRGALTAGNTRTFLGERQVGIRAPFDLASCLPGLASIISRMSWPMSTGVFGQLPHDPDFQRQYAAKGLPSGNRTSRSASIKSLRGAGIHAR